MGTLRFAHPTLAVFYIQSGKVKKMVVSEQGKEAVVALLGTGDFFGEECLTGQTLHLSSVIAMTECAIVRIPKAQPYAHSDLVLFSVRLEKRS